MDFKRILVTDNLAWQIFGAAAREKFLFVRDAADEPAVSSRTLAGQKALSLIILFDRLVIHDFSDGRLRLPDLENEGVVEIVAAHKPPTDQKPLSTRWREGVSARGAVPQGACCGRLLLCSNSAHSSSIGF